MRMLTKTIVLATAVALTGVTAASAAPAKPNYDARAKKCQAATKGMYSADGRLSAYGFCLSNVGQEVWNGNGAGRR